jgi:hypothetical protein
MKISNILIALIILFTLACTTKNAGNEHGHEHSTEDSDHSHDDDSNHEEQEEFTTGGDSTKVKSTTLNIVNGSDITTSNQENVVTVVVPAKKGVEYKFYLKQYEKLTYEWTSEAPLYFDFHGEPLDYEVTKYFESFTEATSDKMKGTMTVPFEGSHGWYWKNNSEQDVSVTLKTKGNYNVIGLKK